MARARGLTLAALLAVLLLGARMLTAEPAPGRWATVHGHRLYYEVHGRGRPLLLLHAGGNSIAETWSQQIAAFSAGHQVIAPEQVGHGHTPALEAPLSYADMTEDTAALLEQLQLGPADVAGLSDGGIVALMLALRHPKLVRRLVVSGANLSPDGLEERLLQQLRSSPESAADTGGKLRQLWLTHPQPDELSPALLGRITQPVLVMAGERDLIKAAHTTLIYRSLPHARLLILPATGHATFAERAAEINPRVLAFFDQP